METKTVSLSTACLLLGFALLCGLQSTQGFPSVDPPLLYPAGLRRSAEPASLESDEVIDEPQGPPAPAQPAPPASPIGGPALNPLLPLIRLKPGKLGPVVDPTQFIQLKAEILKNLYGPKSAKRYVARAASATGASKWSDGAAWASGAKSPSPAKSKTSTKAAKPTSKPSAGWDWPPPTNAAPAPAPAAPQAPVQEAPASWSPAPAAPQAPASWPQAPAAPQAPASWSPAPAAPQAPVAWAPAPAPAAPAPAANFPTVPGYWIPSSVFPTPADPTDKKAALVEALLDQLLNPPTASPALRLARAPVADPASTGPSPQLTDLLNSLNLTVPDTPASLTPTIEPPGFWFPSVVPAPPGSLLPFTVDPTAQIAKKTKFLGDLFATKVATKAANKAALAAAVAAAAAGPAPAVPAAPSSTLVAREVDAAQISTYINDLLDSVNAASSPSKRASGVAPKKSKPAKPTKAPKASKVAASSQDATPAEAAAPALPAVVEEVPQDEAAIDQILGLRLKREILDESEEPAVPAEPEAEATAEPDAAAEKAKATAALLNDMATVKQNILVQLDAMSKAESAASKAVKAATKANKKATTLAALLNLPIPTTTAPPPVPVTDYQQKISALTNIYSSLSDTLKNITSAPDASDPLNPDRLFVAAVNTKVTKILLRNSLLPTAPKATRSNNVNWHRWRGQQQEQEAAPQYEADNETNRRQKSAVPLVAAVFAPQTHTYSGRQPNWWN